MKPFALVLLIVLSLLLVAPTLAYVANSSTVVSSYTDTQFSNPAYMPYQYEILIIAIGFVSLLGMKYNQEIEVLLGIMSMIAFGIATWFAAYLSINEIFTLVDTTDGTTTILYTQLVTPQPILQIMLAVCFIFSFVATLYVLFLRDADKKLDSNKQGVRY